MSGGAAPAFGPAFSAALRLGTDAELRGWVEAALGWCDETDAIALDGFRRIGGIRIDRKPDRSFVTESDTAVERALRERIAAAFPDHGVLGEEYGSEAAGASVRWYVDPIDGTHNFLRGVPVWATLLAVERDGELQAAVVSAPALRGRWFAWRGGGAWAAGAAGAEASRRIATSGIARLDEAQVLYASPTDVRASGRAPGFDALVGAAWRERGFGDFWGYALLAEGAAEAMVEIGLSPWDAAAPLVLVEEAGGRVTDLEGRRRIDTGTFLATNGHLHDEVLATLLRT